MVDRIDASAGASPEVLAVPSPASSLPPYDPIFENSADGVCILAADGHVVDANPRAAEMSGYTRDEMRQMFIWQFDPGASPEEALANLSQIRVKGQAHFEDCHHRKDGSIFWTETSVHYSPAGEGRFFAVFRDVTTRKRSEQMMLARLRLVAVAQDRALNDVLQATVDEAEALTASSIGFCHFVDEDQEHLHLQAWSSNTAQNVCSAEGAGRHYPVSEAGVWVDCLKTKAAVIHNDYASLPHRRGLPAGHAPVVRELVVPVVRGGLIVAILGVGNKLTRYDQGDVEAVEKLADLAWDIAAHKKSDDERRDMERQLLHAQKLESLGVLAGGIAHDFNNLLMAIMGNLDVALQDIEAGADGRSFIDEAMRAARRASELTQQMLAYSGRGKFLVRPIDLGAVIEAHLPLFRTAVGGRVTLDLEIAPTLPTVLGDAEQIQQALINLLTNAADAIGEEPGVVRIVVRDEHLDADALADNQTFSPVAPGRFVTVSVLDTGCGMDAQTKARLFDPFFTTKFTGRGLGLPAVQGIMRGHKGGVFISSGPGSGSLVRLAFPASPAPTTSPSPLRSSAAGSAGAEPVGRVLVADDETAVALLCQRMLERMGYHVVCVQDGEAALSAFETAPQDFSCVLVDLTMPKVDGLTVARRIREIRGDIPVLVSSGYGRETAAAGIREVGASGFIQKPYTMRALRDAITRATGPTRH